MAKRPNFNKNIRKTAKTLKQTSQKGASKVGSGVKTIAGPTAKPAPTSSKPKPVTNKTLEEHREEVLKGARRFIYPLQHSKHKIALYSGIIIILVSVVLLTLTSLMLYRWQSTGSFAYRVTQVVPFPVARMNGDFISYEDYLFELRHNLHFLTEQEQVNFTDNPGQLAGTKRQALAKVKENALIKKAAKDNGITVTEEEIDAQIETIRTQGGVSGADEALETTLRDYYDWDLDDLRRVVELQLLKQKVTPLLDTDAKARAEAARADLDSGMSFKDVAAKHSDDIVTNENGGELRPLSLGSEDYPTAFVEAAFALGDGQTTDQFVETVFGLHIIRNLEVVSEEEVRVAHVFIQYKNIDEVLAKSIEEANVSDYISVE